MSCWTRPRSRSRFPQFRLQGHERAYFEPGAGFVRPEACIEAQLDEATRLGAEVHTGETVVGFDASGSTGQGDDRPRFLRGGAARHHRRALAATDAG